MRRRLLIGLAFFAICTLALAGLSVRSVRRAATIPARLARPRRLAAAPAR